MMKKATLFLILVIFLANLLDAQILHVYLPDTMDKSRYTLPSVWGDRMVIIDKKYSSFNPEKYFFRFYKRFNHQWNLQSSIKAEDYSIYQFGFRGFMMKDFFIILSFRFENVSYKTKLFIFKEKKDSFILNDIIDFNKTYTAHAMAVSEDWILVRVFTKKYPVELTDYFFHNEQDHWVLRDKHSYLQPFQFDYYGPDDDRADISKDYAVVSNFIQRPQHKNQGILSVYKRNGLKWDIIQKIYEPGVEKEKSALGYMVSMSPDGRLIATQSLGERVPNFHIFKSDENTGKYELDYQDTIFNRVRFDIGNDDLIIASDTNVWYYVKQNDNWRVKCKLNSRLEGIGGFHFGSYYSEFRQGETAVTDHRINDSTHLITTFQIPARDTLSLSICQGDTYNFNGRMLGQSGHYVDTLESSYCIDSVVQLYLTVYPKDRIEIDTVLCDDQQLIIGDSVLTEEGIYTITLQNQYGCDSIVIAKIEYDYQPEVTDSITADYGCQNGEIKLSVEGNNPPYAFDWSGGQTGEYLSGLSYGKYNVTITSHSGCEYDYEYEVGDSIAYLIPNAFFPSGQEEINKEFRPYLAKDVHIISTEIFDRWGEKVFYGGEDEIWDGTYKGMMQSPGVYLYKILIDSPCGEEVKTGQVVLLR